MNRPLTVKLDHHPTLNIEVHPDTATSWQTINANTLTALENLATTLTGDWNLVVHTPTTTITVTPQ